MADSWRKVQQGMVVVHRWLGVAVCLLCALWFGSGLVMMYVPFPALGERDRLTYEAPLDWSQVRTAPDQAMATAHAAAFPARLELTMLQGRPVWRVREGRRLTTVSAVDGARIDAVSADDARDIVRRARPDHLGALRVQAVDDDQWTVSEQFEPHRPLYRVALGDPEGTVLYVSSNTGQIVQKTTAPQRFWNGLGAVPHWLYFTALRRNGAVWTQAILWTSGLAFAGAVLGTVLGVLRLGSARGRHADRRLSPYRGWMQWHHLAGLAGGLFVLTWLFSGWLSMNPFGWLEGSPPDRRGLAAYAGHDKPDFPANLLILRGLGRTGAREARLLWVGGRPLVVSTAADLGRTAIDARTGQPAALTDAQILAWARALEPGAAVTGAQRLTHEDAYWYAHHETRRLPVLRIRFADPQATWFHLDPLSGEIVGVTDRDGRGYRWLFSALHDLDLAPLLANRPLWDIAIWTLLGAGMIVSVSGVVIGWRRLKLKFTGK